jgi:hypothetical protein
VRPLIAWTAALAVTAGVLSGCSGSAHKPPTAVASPPPAPPPGAALSVLQRMHWSPLPPGPLGPRQQAVTAWTGKAFVVVGGAPVRGTVPGTATAAAYDPKARTWTSLPDLPLAARIGVASAWTGYGLVVWGGETGRGDAVTPTKALGDGAILDVAERQWHVMPPGPLLPVIRPTAVTDAADQVVVLGGEPDAPERSSGGVLLASRRVASYDPATRRWRSLPSLPAVRGHDVLQVDAVRWGRRILVAATWEHVLHPMPGETTGNGGVDLFLLDPATGRWSPFRAVTTAGLIGADLRPLGSFLAIGGGTSCPPFAACPFQPSSFAVVDARGQALGGVTVPPIQLRAETTVGDSYVVMTGSQSSGPGIDEQPGDTAAFDLASKHWIALPSARVFKPEPESLTWTGHELIALSPTGIIALQAS